MKLNVYKGKEVVKTYTADKYDLMFGTLEDVVNTVKLDELKSGSNIEIINLTSGLVVSGDETVKKLMKDIFDGLTDEELRNAKVVEIAQVLIDIVKYTVEQLVTGFGSKN